MNSKVKILYICNDLPYFNLHWKHRALKSQEAGYEVFVAAPGASSAADPALEWIDIPIDRKSRNPSRELRSLFSLWRVIRDIKPHLIHTATIKPNIFAGLISRLGGKTPVVMSVTGLGSIFSRHDVATRLLRSVILFLYRFLGTFSKAYFLFENYDDRTFFLQHGVGDETRCIRIPGAGVDMSAYAPVPEPNEGPCLVVLPSRMLWEKGVGEFVKAAEILRGQGVEARFALVGDTDAGSSAAVSKEQLSAWAESGVVEWWGFQKDMGSVLAQSNIVCLPTFYREGIPRALIEAAACGRAIVTTDSPGCREIVRDGYNGLLVPVNNVERLAGALRTLIENPPKRQEFGVRGREIALKEYSQEQVVKDTFSVYQRILL